MDIKELGNKLSMYENIDEYDLQMAGDDKYAFCYVTELEKNGKRYEAWQVHERRADHSAGNLIYDKEVYDKIAEKLLEQFPNFDIMVSSRQYKYAPEMKAELLLCIPVEVGEFYHFMEGDKFKMEGIDGLCTITDYDEINWRYTFKTEDGRVLDFGEDDMPKITLLKETNEAWGTMGGGSWELEIPDELVDAICTSGDNEPAVREALKDERIRKQFDEYSDEEIDKIFDYDGFDMTQEEKNNKTREEKEMYILWSAAWDASENSLDESVEDDVKDHKNLAPEVDADELKKEIENKKEEKPKMALTKKLWKEITGKIELDKEDKKITKQVEESIASKLISELDSINEGKLPNGAFDIPDIKTSLKNDYLQGKLTAEEVAKELHKAGWKSYVPDEDEALKMIHVKESVNEDDRFNYMMLDRLRTDCEYFLGNGNGNEKVLWAGNVEDQIAEMRKIYDKLPEKPEWLSLEDIDKYEKDMLAKKAKNESSDEIVQAVADKRQADFDKALEDEIAAKDEVNAEHSRGSQLGTHISLGRFSKLHKDRLEKQKKLNRNKELMDARNKSKDESSDEIVNAVAEKRKEAARKAIAKMNIVNAEHDAELDKIQNKYSDEEIVAGKADAEIDAINAKYEPIETELNKPIKKFERNHELMKKRKHESKLNEKDDVVYELENIKTGHTVWSHSKRMPGYKWTGKQSKNTEPNYEDGGLK